MKLQNVLFLYLNIVLQGWDSRQISATVEDLEEGRVTITKQRGKDKGL